MNKTIKKYIEYLKFDNLLETLLTLLENKETIIRFPLVISCTFVFLMYSQAVGFIAQTETVRKLNESQIIFFGHWNEYSPGTYLLLVTGNDTLSIIFFVLAQICLYSIIFYLIYQTIQRMKQTEQNKNQSVSDTPLSKILNKVIQLFIQSFFSLFLWILYVPFAEISSGVASCSKFGFLAAQRQQCDKMSVIQMIFAVISAVITLGLGLLINKFYVSYDFLDPNYLKRRYRANQNICLFCKSAMIFIFYQDLPIYSIKYGFSHVLGMTMIYDWVRYLPFVNKTINVLYGTIAFIYYSIIILYNLWEVWPNQPLIKEYNIFYIWVTMWPFFYGFAVMYIERFYEDLLTITPFQENIDKADFIDYYLEEIYRLSENSKNNIKDKIKLQGIMQNYYNIFKQQGYSDNDNLYNKILDENNEVNKEVITQIINQLFVKFLDHIKSVKRIKVQRQELMEHISLKYFLFLANKQDNPVQAYFQIKKMGKNQRGVQQNSSGKLYTNAIKIVCDGLERKIVLKYRSWAVEGNNRSFNYNNGFENIHKYKIQQIKCLVEITNTKYEFWQKLCEGFTHMETFWNDTYQKSSNLIRLKRQFETLEMVLSSNPELKDNVIILKLQSLFASLLLNSDVTTMKQEAKISQILKSDASQIKNSINSQTILEGKSVMLTGSMLLNEGEIIHPVSERTAQFFGYKDSDEFSKQVIKIEQLLTDGLAAKHTLMIKKFVKTGKTKNIQKERLIQFVDKQGFMNQGQIFYTFNFENKGDFCINSMITSINPENQCLIFTKNGRLERMQKVFFDNYIQNSMFSFNYLQNDDCRTLQLNLLKSGVFFPMFIPQLLSYINEKNTANIYNDKTYILIPKNILSFLQNFLIVIDHYIQQQQEQDFPEFTSIKKIKKMAGKQQQLTKGSQEQKNKKSKKREESKKKEDLGQSKNSDVSKVQLVEHITQDIDFDNYMSQLPILIKQMNKLQFSIKNDKHRDYLNYFLEEYLFNLEENYVIYMGNVNLRLQQFNQPDTPEYLEQYLLFLTDVQEISIQQYNQLIQQEHGANQLQQKMKKEIGQQIQNDLEKKDNSIQDIEHKENPNMESFNLYSDLNSVEELDEEQRFLKENKNFKRFNSESQQEEENENNKKLNIQQTMNIQKDNKDVSLYSLNVNDIADDKEKDNMANSYVITKEPEVKDDYSDMKNFSVAEIDMDENQLMQDKQIQQQNQTNAGSSYGLNFVTDIVTNKKKIRLTRNIAILSYLQLIFFISINVGYLLAIQDQINTFQNKFNNILSIDGGLYSYSQTLYGQLFGRLMTEGKIVNTNSTIITNYNSIQRQLLMDSHKWLRETLKTKEFFKEQILNRHIDIYNVNNDNSILIDKRNLFQLLNYIETQLFQKENNYQSGTTNPYLLQQQMTIQMNFDQFQSQIRDLQNSYNQEIIEQKTQFLNFYISISICGFIIGLALQMINMPLVYNFQNYIERVLMLLARISEREARNEYLFFMNCSKILKKNSEIYLLKTFTHGEKDQEMEDINQIGKKGNKNANTSYLSNKIQNPKLNRVKNFGLNFITLLAVGIYFSIFFVLIKTLTDKLEYSVSLNNQQKEFKMNMMMADLLAPIILTGPFTKANDFKKNADSIPYQRQEFEKAFNYLKTVETQFSVFFSNEMPASSRDKLQSLLNTNEGFDNVGFQIINDKTAAQNDYIRARFKNIYQTNFKYGFLGMNQQTQSSYQTLFTNIMGQNAVDQALITKYYGQPETVIDLMSNYQVKTQLQRKFTSIVNDGIVQIMNQLNQTFIIVCGLGGGICATLLMIVILYFYSQLQQQMESARFALVLIPIKKLQEDATMHLLKKLDNI